MIEKFTPEELEIIKKELNDLPKDHPKRSTCEKPFKQLRILLKNKHHYSGVDDSPYQIEDDILTLADKILCNYELRPKSGKYRRYIYIRKEIKDDYIDFINDIIDVIGKHIKYYIEGENE